MGKIIRLSLNNIKKHKLESAAMVVLIMYCMLLLGSSLASFPGIERIFPDMMERTGAYENYIGFNSREYNADFEAMLAEDERVTAVEHTGMLYDMSTRFTDKKGEKQALYMAFITESGEQKIEHSERETSLSEKEINAMEHPIYMPCSAKYSLGLKEGDDFDVICGTRHFPFTVAGFYESSMLNDAGVGMKMIVTDEDYHLLSGVIGTYDFLFYNSKNKTDGMDIYDDLNKRLNEEKNVNMESVLIMADFYTYMEQGVTQSIKLLLVLMILMSVIIIVCVSFMILFRISTEIRQQIVSIGILEALGYKSGQIALSYVLEYVIAAAVGIILGTLGSLIFSPAIYKLGEMISGYSGDYHNSVLPIAFSAAVILVFVAGIAFIKSLSVRKYPPVAALRKGMTDHHFGKEFFPLSKTKGNVHVRLAMKNFASHLMQSAGLAVCMTLAVTTVLTSYVMYDVLGKDAGFIRSAAGIELSDIRMSVTETADAEALAEQIKQNKNVRKVLLNTSIYNVVSLPDQDIVIAPNVYKDFSETENINVIEGRFPENDNEIMITKIFDKMTGVKVGDSVNVTSGSCTMSYIVTGEVVSLTNGGANFYLTEAGMKRLDPLYKPQDIEIYLKEGTDKEEFREYLTASYGRSLADIQTDAETAGDSGDKIKAAADKRIAEMMAMYGVSHVEYAITVDDEVITGNNDDYIVKSFYTINEILDTQLSGISSAVTASTVMFTMIAAAVVAIILLILMSSTIRKQRKDFGIMKSMGYTSRELMLQLAFRIVPASLTAILIGDVLTFLITNFLSGYIGKMMMSIPHMIIVDVCILVFCFVCAYAGARRIKKISVCELMSE